MALREYSEMDGERNLDIRVDKILLQREPNQVTEEQFLTP
jgi:hypothetical protein